MAKDLMWKDTAFGRVELRSVGSTVILGKPERFENGEEIFGRPGWRLPSIQELIYMRDLHDEFGVGGFRFKGESMSYGYWSSDLIEDDPVLNRRRYLVGKPYPQANERSGIETAPSLYDQRARIVWDR